MASIQVLLPDPAAHVAHWRQQLGLIARQGATTASALEVQAREPGTTAAAQTRLHALAGAIREHVADLTAAVGPALGGALPPGEVAGLPRGIVEYVGYLYRDWAWSGGQHEENLRALSAIRRLAGDRPLGRTLVLGAGACRLAYDLHRRCGGTETAVVDVDPYLLVIAEAVIRGGSVRLTESAANVQQSDAISRRWTLAAPDGPLADDVFHFYLADGTEPPFEDETFDTIVTPWFIDQVPADVPGFLATLRRLLAPSGRWLNHGPLIYRPDMTPMTRWYPREELFDLAAAAGLNVTAWESESCPYLVSPLTGRGRIELVFTSLASRP